LGNCETRWLPMGGKLQRRFLQGSYRSISLSWFKNSTILLAGGIFYQTKENDDVEISLI
jgi:hypothetical protein